MIDFGLVALVVLLLLLVGATWRAYDGIKREMAPIASVKAEQLSIREAVAATMDRIDKIELDHYKALVRRLDAVDNVTDALNKNQMKSADAIVSLQSKLGALKRWNKKEQEEDPQPLEQTSIQFEKPEFQAGIPPAPANQIKSNFGRTARKVA